MQSTPFKHLKTEIYRAGAGAGKTTTLVQKVLDVAKEYHAIHRRFPQIVVTTFTRKATQELRERLMLKAQAAGDTELLEYVLSPGGLHISTIHGVLSLFLRRYAHKLNIDPEFKLLDQKESQKLLKNILRSEIVRDRSFDLLVEDYGFEKLSQFLIQYYSRTLEHGEIRPFSREDFSELLSTRLERVRLNIQKFLDQLSIERPSGKWQEYGDVLKEIKTRLDLGWEQERAFILERIAQLKKPAFSANKSQVSAHLNELAALAKDDLSELQELEFNTDLWPKFFETFELFDSLAKKITRVFRQKKIDLGQFDFSDLELLSIDFLRMHPEIAQNFSSEWDYWLIDEYQDTSPLQVEILGRLIGESPYFVVGDPQQSIYLFRGARKEVFENKQTEIRDLGGVEWVLDKNYRSSPQLLAFLNRFFMQFTGTFLPMEARGKEGSKDVAHIALAPDEPSEIEAVVEHVQRLLSQNVPPQEICILARTNRHLVTVSERLRTLKVPYQLHSSTGFIERREIKDALFLLKFLVNPLDELNLFGLLRTPWYYVSDFDLAEVRRASPQHKDLWEYLLSENVLESVKPVVQLLDGLRRRCLTEGVSSVFISELRSFLDLSFHYDPSGLRESNLWKLICRLRSEEKRPGFTYFQFISSHESAEVKGEEVTDSDAVPSLEPERVQLMTIHMSKGLQFKHVLLPFIGKRPQLARRTEWVWDEECRRWALPILSGDPPEFVSSLASFPVRDRMRRRELEESDRLLYVALTRAKESVFLSATEPAQANSWLSRIEWPTDSAIASESKVDEKTGEAPHRVIYETDDYRFAITRSGWKSDINLVGHTEEILVRQPFEKLNMDIPRSLSVTERTSMALPQFHAFTDRKKLVSRIQKSNFGVDIHRLLETLKYHSIERSFEYADHWFGDESESAKAAVKYLIDLEKVPFKRILSAGYAEWGFSLQLKSEIVRGQIDLWGVVDDVLWIVDYKTGSSEHLEKAFLQLSMYALAVTRFLKDETPSKIQLAVLYPFEEKLAVQSLSKYSVASEVQKTLGHD